MTQTHMFADQIANLRELVVNDLGCLQPVNGSPSELQKMRLVRVQTAIHERHRRAEHFRSEMFADPSWDVLLELYAAELSQEQRTVSQLGLRSNTPASTAVRWLKILECDGLVTRTIDPVDACNVVVCLTRKGASAMSAYFRGGPGA